MANVATLGLAVDSSGVQKGANDLNDLTNAAKKAEGASGVLKAAFARLEASLASIEQAVRGVETAVLGMGKGVSTAESRVVNLGATTGRATGQLQQMIVTGANVSVTFGKLDAAVTQAATAITREGAAAVSAAGSAEVLERALTSEAAAAAKATKALSGHAVAANSNVKAASNLNTANIAAQFQDIAVSAQAGMGAMQIGLQQGTQLAAVISTMERPLHGLAAGFASVFSPINLAVISLTALAAAGLQMVDWAKLGSTVLRTLAAAIQPIAPYAVAAAAGLALLYGPAMVAGVVQLIALMARLAVTATVAAAAMAAANPAAALILGLVAAVAAANIFRDELTQIFGVDIVGVAKTAANYVLNSFTAAYEDLKFIWGNFGDIMGAAVVGGVNLAIDGINKLISGAGASIDWLINKINAIPGVDVAKVGSSLQLDRLANPAADRLASANAAHKSSIDQIMSRDTIGDFGAGIAKGASAATAKLKELAAGLTAVDEKTKKKARGGKTDGERFEDIVRDADARIASLRAEQAGIGLSADATARLRYEQELLNRATQAGLTLDPAQISVLKEKAAAMASLEVETSKLRDAYDFAKGTFQGFFQDIRSGIADGKGLWSSLADAALNALDRISQKLVDMATDQLFASLWGNLAGVIGGGGGGFMSIGGTGGMFANGAAFAGGRVTAFANGGVVNTPTVFPMAKGMGLMGEAGPEAVMPLRRLPGGRLGVESTGRGGGSNVISFAPVTTITVQGNADKDTISQLKAELDRRDRALKEQIPGLVTKAQVRGQFQGRG
ncbi:phage tail tape-measure protein [Kaistia sp. UC242_56]|uniref:phage tail tape-measure protein n=1 Tax=Kaistia sp. UC242_56 TaxID=3374625 RepID=UPI0037921C99